MKIYLASFHETHNHGPGRKIAITDSKPNNIEIKTAYPPWIPAQAWVEGYQAKLVEGQEKASQWFIEKYSEQLDEFFQNVQKKADATGKTVIDILPFQEGDTLLFWEREGYRSCRTVLAQFLVNIGYEIIIH